MENTPANEEQTNLTPETTIHLEKTPFKWKRYLSIILTLTVIIYGTYFGVTRFWPIGDKQTAGDLQSFGSDGRVIKTFEGRLLTNELFADPNSGISERVLKFSADKFNDTLMMFLNKNVGKRIIVHYRKYSKPFFFRGQSEYVVYDADVVVPK